ncbi:MAG: hypothetical protein AB8G11_22385 [Saprospiraceae bacterium]
MATTTITELRKKRLRKIKSNPATVLAPLRTDLQKENAIPKGDEKFKTGLFFYNSDLDIITLQVNVNNVVVPLSFNGKTGNPIFNDLSINEPSSIHLNEEIKKGEFYKDKNGIVYQKG